MSDRVSRRRSRLKDIRIHEISLVDKPANELARIVLAKRDSSDDGKKGAGGDSEGCTAQLSKHADDWRAEKLQKLMDWSRRHPWEQDRFEIELDAICPRIDKSDGVVKMSDIETIESGPTNTGQNAYDVLMAKADQMRERFPHLSEAQAFTRVYEDPANSDLVMAERRGSGMYANDHQLEDATAVAKAAVDTLRSEPKSLGNYSTGPAMSMSSDVREGFPSADEITALVNLERKKGGISREAAFDRVASRLLKAEQDSREENGELNL